MQKSNTVRHLFVSYGSRADQEQELKQGWVIIKGIVEDDADWTIIVNYIRAYAREAKIDCLMLRTNSYTRQMEKGYKSFIQTGYIYPVFAAEYSVAVGQVVFELVWMLVG